MYVLTVHVHYVDSNSKFLNRFRSLHCHLYPNEDMCVKKQEEREKQQEEFKKQLAEKDSKQDKANPNPHPANNR